MFALSVSQKLYIKHRLVENFKKVLCTNIANIKISAYFVSHFFTCKNLVGEILKYDILKRVFSMLQ